MEVRLKKIEERLDRLEKLLLSDPTLAKPTKRVSVKEFLLDRKPKSEIEVTLFIGYFLEKIESKSSFGVGDLRAAFRAAKMPPPKNINDTVNKNISKGYFMEADKKEKGQKTWMLTATGEKHAEGEKKNE
ncbi:MAG: hypothetical protein UU21_C0002G0004 [Candidatus Levybacteria bacterium GW2011_GWA2_40_8]|nr:MAG: hypothetical protein UU21_C0002G0004 [Candidatus Levybacteria bacterium GW2011_GWA2_40_8]